MVPPRTEPANRSGSPNTTTRATEFMLRWKTWAIGGSLRSERGDGPAGGRRNPGADSEFHEDQFGQLGAQERGRGRDTGNGDPAEGVIEPASWAANSKQNAGDAESGGSDGQ